MSVIIPFVGRAQLTAQQNLEAFIQHAQDLRIFHGAHAISWHDNSWDLTPWVKYRGSGRSYKPQFVDYDSGGRSKKKEPLPQPFMDTAKALAAYTFDHNGPSAPYRWIIALRVIEKAFKELGRESDITALDVDVLSKAAEIVLSRYEDPTDVGISLEKVAEAISRLCLCKLHLAWKFPSRKPQNQARSVNVRPDGASDVSGKLPHLKCILDLASVFQNATTSVDMITTGWFALSMFSPNRVSEILALPVDCETEMDGVYGLSWQPSKGGDPMTKFATSAEWEEVARIAIRRMIDLGAPARQAAAWYADNPRTLYLPPELEHLRNRPTTRLEIARIIGTRHVDPATMNKMGIVPSGHTTRDPDRTEGKEWAKLYTFESVSKWVLDQLPKEWLADKLLGTHAKDALFCVPRHAMSGRLENQSYIPMLISDGQINKSLSHQTNSIFRRHNLRNPDTGDVWVMTTHQPRHFLNTLAQSKHLSQTLIAFWSGRKKVDQNQWYNHIPHEAFIEAYVEMGQHAPREIRVMGPLDDKIADRARKEQVSKEEALKLELGSVIATRYGLCRHNYALTPCPKDKACIDCGENTFIKGDARQITEARSQLAISQAALENCRTAIAEGEPGVERWLLKHETSVARWTLALEQLTDPAVTEGTLITLPAPEVSETKTGLSRNIRIAENPEAVTSGDSMFEFLALGGDY